MDETCHNPRQSGFHLHGSSRLEWLAAALATALRQPGPDPLAEREVLVYGPSMARWLDQQLTRQNGISCRIRYLLPGNWLWSLYRRLEPDLPLEDPLSRERLPWQVYTLLQQSPAHPHLPDELASSLADRPERERWQMAEQIADLLDQYQYYRPDWLLQWSREGSTSSTPIAGWQAWVWQQLHAQHPENRVSLLHRLQHRLQESDSAILPARLDCFALPGLPDVMVQILDTLAQKLPVHFWQFQPSPQFWQDLVDEKKWAEQRLAGEDSQWLLRGHPLLVDWGRRIVTLDRQIWTHTQPLHENLDENRTQPPPTTLLHRLQQAIRRALPEEEPCEPAQLDGSIQIHSCHTPLRECEILRDHLLHRLQHDPELQAEDILVMTSDMAEYAPCIHAVFGSGPSLTLPYNLSDLSAQDEHPIVRSFLQWLALPHSRLGFSEVWAQLESPAVQRAFGLDEAILSQLQSRLQAASARWGLNPDHRRQLQLPDHEWYSWQQAMDRLLLGQALDDDTFLGGISPIPMHRGNDDLQPIGLLARYLARLDFWRQVLSGTRHAQQWATLLQHMLQDMSQPVEDEQEGLQAIGDWLARLAEAPGEPVVPLDVIQTQAQAHFSRAGSQPRQYSGGITFCGLQPLRGVPFRIICLLGMDDSRFPRRDLRPHYDGLRSHPRPGDPHPGLEDRSLMLETFMATREQLWISYSGQDPQTGEHRPAALPVRQLQHNLWLTCGKPDEGPEQFALRRHRLHPFHPANYTGERPSFQQQWLDAARCLDGAPSTVSDTDSWPAIRISPVEPPRQISPTELMSFFSHPIRNFLQRHLGLKQLEENGPAEDEPFHTEGLQQWQLRQRLLHERYGLQSLEPLELLSAGLLPPPPLAQEELEQQRKQIERRWPDLPDDRGRQWRRPEVIDLQLQWEGQSLHILGPLEMDADDLGLFCTDAGSPHLGKWARLHTAHLLACANGLNSHTLWLYEGKTTLLQPLPPEQAKTRLSELLGRYLQGLHSPPMLLPRTGWALKEQLEKGKDDTRALQQAFNGSHRHRGDLHDTWINRWLQGSRWRPWNDPEFSRWTADFIQAMETAPP